MRILILLAVLALASMAGPGRVDAQITDVIRGRVTGPDTSALPGVTVKATSSQGMVTKTATTDKNGRFTIIFINGEGDYWVEFSRIGFTPQRRQLKRIGTEEILIVDARLTATAALDTVTVNAQRPGVRGLPNRAGDPDVGGGSRDITNAAVTADQLGNLAAMAATIAGIQIIPGMDGAADMYSVLGLSGDQNSTEFNGIGSGINFLPPDIIASTSITPYSFDPANGGFSGGQISVSSLPGSNYSRRRVSHNNILPQLEWADEIAVAQAQKFTTMRLGGNAAGPLIFNKAFYNTAYNVNRRTSDARTLFNTTPLGLAAAGVSSDSVARFQDILRSQGIPGVASANPRQAEQTTLSASANFDVMPSSAGTGSSFLVGLLGNYVQTDPVGGGLLSTPARAGKSRRSGGNAGLMHTNYFGFGILSKTTLGISLSKVSMTPYLELPSGAVRVRSDLSDGSSPVRSLAFGGNSSLFENENTTAQLRNQLSWFSADNEHTFKIATSLVHATYSTDNGAGTLGNFTFNSLADLDEGRAATFNRTLTRRRESAAQLTAAASIGDYWRPASNLQLQGGVRLDINQFLDTPAFNQSVFDAFGVRNDHVPEGVYLSPRIGLQWYYGKAPTVAFTPGAARLPRAVIHAGVGVFQNTAGPQILGNALTATGLANSTQTMACAGGAVPIPDWRAFLDDADLIPSQCADGSAGTVYATASPNVNVFDATFRQARSVRGAADWAGPVLDNRFMVGVQGIVSHDMHQPGTVDINFDPTMQFTLDNEGGRPVYASPSAIVPATGSIAPGDARVSSAFQRVSMQRSGLEQDSRMLNIGLSPITANRSRRWTLTYTLLDARQQFYGFSSTTGNPFDIERGPNLQSGKHRVMIAWESFPIFDLLYISANVTMSSGMRYTPRIAGDVNGDGVSNDRAFIVDPTTATDSAMVAGMRSLLEHGAPSARECLAKQLNAFAARGSCRAPWTATAWLSIRFNPTKIGLPKRTTVSLNFQNPLALADLALHRGSGIRGWGQQIQPDQTLLFVRGFDASARQFRYDVNERFGSTRPQQATNRSLTYMSMGVSLDIGAPRERQLLTARLDEGRGRPGVKAGDRSVWQLGVQSIPNPMAMVLIQADSLRLTREQADSMAQLAHHFAVFADSIWTPAARGLVALPNSYDKGEAYRTYVDARERTVDYLLSLVPAAKKILTAKQKRRLPLQITNYLDERVLRFLRSSSAGAM